MVKTVMIKCPKTEESVNTGMAMDEGSFASATISRNSFSPCPSCGGSHTWDKADAFLG